MWREIIITIMMMLLINYANQQFWWGAIFLNIGLKFACLMAQPYDNVVLAAYATINASICKTNYLLSYACDYY